MGQVCSNPLDYLIDEYGEDVGKFIVVQKTKEYFDEEYPAVKKELNNQTTNFQKEVMKKVDIQSSDCIFNITTNINQLKETKKTEIELFQKNSNRNVDEFVGVGELKDKFDGLKEKSKVSLAGLEKKILSEADVLADKQRGVILAQKPSIPIYDKLPQCLQDKVWEEGNKRYGARINEEREKQENFLKKTLNFEQLKKKYGGELPTDEISNISSSAEEKLGQVKKAVDMSGKLGSLSGKLGNLF